SPETAGAARAWGTGFGGVWIRARGGSGGSRPRGIARSARSISPEALGASQASPGPSSTGVAFAGGSAAAAGARSSGGGPPAGAGAGAVGGGGAGVGAGVLPVAQGTKGPEIPEGGGVSVRGGTGSSQPSWIRTGSGSSPRSRATRAGSSAPEA